MKILYRPGHTYQDPGAESDFMSMKVNHIKFLCCEWGSIYSIRTISNEKKSKSVKNKMIEKCFQYFLVSLYFVAHQTGPILAGSLFWHSIYCDFD